MTGADLFSRKSVLQAYVSKDARSGGSCGIAFMAKDAPQRAHWRSARCTPDGDAAPFRFFRR